jgi:hypothetical protein
LTVGNNCTSIEYEGQLATKKGVTIRFIADEGHGSHGRVYFGSEFTTLKDRKKEIGPG